MSCANYKIPKMPVQINNRSRIWIFLIIIIVDDNSPDGTGHIADELMKKNDQIYAADSLERKPNTEIAAC